MNEYMTSFFFLQVVSCCWSCGRSCRQSSHHKKRGIRQLRAGNALLRHSNGKVVPIFFRARGEKEARRSGHGCQCCRIPNLVSKSKDEAKVGMRYTHESEDFYLHGGIDRA